MSPDSVWEAFTKNYNLFIRSIKNDKEFQLSFDGTEGHFYAPQILWSPDSKKIVANRVKPGYERLVHYIETSPEDQVQPKQLSRVYPKPGDVITVRKPQLLHVEQKKKIQQIKNCKIKYMRLNCKTSKY